MKPLLAAALLAALPALISPAPAQAQSKELLLFNWSNYTPPELLKRFTAETGIKVTLDTYDTNESMLSKLQAGGAGYDVVVPTGPTVQNMIRNGLLLKADVNAMPNFKNVAAAFAKPEFDPDRAYSAPYMWGITAIAYDSAKLPGITIDDTWKELFEPRPELVGKIAMLKDMGEVFTAAALYLGYDSCTAKPEEGQKILELLEKQKPAVKIYSAEGTIDRVATGEVTMHHMWNGSFHRARKRLATATYVIPREGVNLWGDNFAIPKGAKNVENAKLFLNWMMDPKNAAEASNFTGYNNGIAGSDAFLNQDLRDNPAVNAPAAMVARFRATKECSKEGVDLRQRIWTRLLR